MKKIETITKSSDYCHVVIIIIPTREKEKMRTIKTESNFIHNPSISLDSNRKIASYTSPLLNCLMKNEPEKTAMPLQCMCHGRDRSGYYIASGPDLLIGRTQPEY